MCGLTACYSTCSTTNKAELYDQISASISAIGHRGPDSAGIYVADDGHVGLGHVRLSIIDLEGGQQPMHVDETHATVTGELYDYSIIRQELESLGCKFQTSCDSELVLHLYRTYGQNLFFHLRGEFAFVLYDSHKDLLIAGRDRFGIKPLYYTVVDGRLLLASEMKALSMLGWKPEWDVDSIINMGDYNDDRRFSKASTRSELLLAAHSLTFRRTDHSYPHPETVETRTIEEMILGVRERIVDSVRARLRSDVPLGVNLRGGIDSACVAGIAAQLLKEQDPNAKLATFALAFPGRADLDEGPVAQRMADSIGAIAHMVAPTEDDLVRYFEQSVYHAEQPVLTLHGSGKIILSEFVRRQGSNTFGGYSFLLLDYIRATDPASAQLGIPLPSSTELEDMVKVLEGMKPPQDHVSISQLSFTDSLQVWATTGVPAKIFSSEALTRFGRPDHARTIAEGTRVEARAKAVSGEWHPLNTALYTVTKMVLSNGILNYVGERPEMASSIEGRPPFLDHHVVDYANTLPPSVKVMPRLHSGKWSFTEKWVLREAVRPFVTDEIYQAKKSQYNVPIARSDNVDPTPLQRLLKERLTVETVGKLGWANWSLQQYLTSPESPLDGGLDKRARILLFILSFVILQNRFKIPNQRFNSS
ncbi:putative asparagine synthase [Mycena floridula]|nr:putative asparagine synthase [Mycena floridula]